MFSGTITEIGVIAAADGSDTLVIAAPKAASILRRGGSLAVSGVQLTAADIDPGAGQIRMQLSPETVRRSTLDELEPGTRVNVELPLALGDRLDGHLVQGHVDAVGKVAGISDEPAGRRVWIRPPARALRELVAKGSVAVDGVSLTVAEIVRDRFSVALIPATLAATTLGGLAEGQRVNLETDLAAKVIRSHPARPAAALAAVIGSLPWAGHLSGRTGAEKAVAQIAAGGAVIVWDPVAEGEGDVIFGGARMSPEAMVFLLTHVCGHTTVPCDRERLDRLEIPPMPGAGDRQGTAMHTAVDLAAAAGTGVSAAERAATIRRLAAPDARPGDFLRPGHVFPLAARPGGLAERAGHTEAGVQLCEAAGLPAVAAVCEVMSPDGTMAGVAELERFALHWGLPLVDIADLTAWL
ncbi:MAG TPA: riboflavin synthase [Streptosporangiaceae bacterium]|jgi:3,4-dihydroxy 2-butanone 4-phosphate synthase/3,4-dihydroxy 2-butanone 4-phosphate synthase/GTP cyclohydrolase II